METLAESIGKAIHRALERMDCFTFACRQERSGNSYRNSSRSERTDAKATAISTRPTTRSWVGLAMAHGVGGHVREHHIGAAAEHRSQALRRIVAMKSSCANCTPGISPISKALAMSSRKGAAKGAAQDAAVVATEGTQDMRDQRLG